MKEHAEFLSDEQIAAEIAQLVNNPVTLKSDSQERDRYFADPANATEIKEQQELMNLVIALYEARHAAGLTQKELADKLGIKQAYIAQIEKCKKNITFSTLSKYAHACGKKIAITLI